MHKSLRSVKKSISKSFRSRSRTPKSKEEEAEVETAGDLAVERNTIDQESCLNLEAVDTVVVASVDAASPKDDDNAVVTMEDIEEIGAKNDAHSDNQLDDCIVKEGESK